MRKTKEDTEISKLRILLAAEEEFCRRGYASANMDSIAKVAGMTKGAIFWHFSSKAGLFKAAIERAIGRVKIIFHDGFSSSEPMLVMEKCREVIKKVKKDKAFEVLLVLATANKIGEIPKELLKDCNMQLSDFLKETVQNLEYAKSGGELIPKTDVRGILITIMLVMSGFSQIDMLKSLVEPIGGLVDDDAVINVLFNGLLSYQNNTIQ